MKIFLSYLVGTLWFITSRHLSKNPDAFTFFNEYELKDKNDWDNLIIVIYFAFTTLSTVGFGDFNPKSPSERLITVGILLIGVALFSYIMGQFIDILMKLQDLTANSSEESENLTKWLGLLAHFNKS